MIGWFYVGGLLLSFTPCVLPMVPILSSIIAGQGGTVSASRGFLLSLSYVLGMALTYTTAGALAALLGGQVQAIFQKPWIITLFAGVFVLLSLGMFGLYELQMPTAIQTRLANLANKQQGGTFIGTALMGALTCPDRHDVRCSSAGRRARGHRAERRRRAWSHGVVRDEHRHGLTALARRRIGGTVAAEGRPVDERGESELRRLDDRHGDLDDAARASRRRHARALGVLVFLTGVFLGAFEPLPENPRASAPARVRASACSRACTARCCLIGATLGGDDPLRPIPERMLAAGAAASGALGRRPRRSSSFARSKSVAALDAALDEARAAGKPVMLDFSADWCVSCKEMEAYTFPDRRGDRRAEALPAVARRRDGQQRR